LEVHLTKVLIYSSHYTHSSNAQYKTYQGRVFYIRKNHLCSLEEHHIYIYILQDIKVYLASMFSSICSAGRNNNWCTSVYI